MIATSLFLELDFKQEKKIHFLDFFDWILELIEVIGEKCS